MPDPRQKLYGALSGKFDLGTQEEFNSKMNNPESRRKLYDAVSKDFDLGTFDEFQNKVGAEKKKSNRYYIYFSEGKYGIGTDKWFVGFWRSKI